jgi:hypothetical protein
MEEAPVAEVGPMEEGRPVERVAMYKARSAAMEDGRRTKTATVDRHPTTAEPAAVKGRAAAAEAAAVETAAATAAKTAAMETATAAAHPTAVLNLGRESISCVFRRRRGAGTRKRERLGTLV